MQTQLLISQEKLDLTERERADGFNKVQEVDREMMSLKKEVDQLELLMLVNLSELEVIHYH